MILKVTINKPLHSLQTVHFLKYILKGVDFFNETLILVFAKFAIFHSI